MYFYNHVIISYIFEYTYSCSVYKLDYIKCRTMKKSNLNIKALLFV